MNIIFLEEPRAAILSIPNYQARAGTEVIVPLQINGANDLAAIRARINFDRNILELLEVTRGPLGGQYDLTWQQNDGVLDIFLARNEGLQIAQGTLVIMRFRVNAGAEAGMYTALMLADSELNDSSGVVSMRRTVGVSGVSGRLTVSDSGQIDNALNGIPDEWEMAHGLDPLTSSPMDDTDGDGRKNLLEFFHARNPRGADASTGDFQAGVPGTRQFQYRRNNELGAVSHFFEWSSDLRQWHREDNDHYVEERVKERHTDHDVVELNLQGSSEEKFFVRMTVVSP